MKAITTKYHGVTNTRGSRIVAKDSDGNRVSVPVDNRYSSEDSHDAAAIALCRKMKWGGPLMRGSLGAGENVYVFDHHSERLRFESFDYAHGGKERQEAEHERIRRANLEASHA